MKVVQNPSPKPTLTQWERHLPQKLVISATPSSNSLELEVGIETTSGASHTLQALLNSGADGLFMDAEYTKANNIATRALRTPIPVFNVDGTANEAGAISEIADVTLRYNGHTECALFAITQLGKQSMILGFTWLQKHNPEVNWQTKSVRMTRCPQGCCNTCRAEGKTKRKEEKKTSNCTYACRSGPFPVLIEDFEEDEEEEGDASDSFYSNYHREPMPEFSDDVETDDYEI